MKTIQLTDGQLEHAESCVLDILELLHRADMYALEQGHPLPDWHSNDGGRVTVDCAARRVRALASYLGLELEARS